MPWHIETGHRDCGGYAVVKDSTGEAVGCHATRAEARKHLAALYQAEPAAGERKLVRDALEDDTLENGNEHGIIVDIDGTLITYDDKPRTAVVEYVQQYDGPIFIVSGRPISDRVATRRLIDSLNIDYDGIYLNDRGNTLAHKKATAERLMRLHGIETAIENDLETRAMYSELGIEYVINPDDVSRYERYQHARKLLAHLLH